MKIGVNSRAFQNGKTGIPCYIENLYREILRTDGVNQYIFFQTDDKRKIGETRVYRAPKNILGAVLFDNFWINKLIEREKVNILHGPANTLPVVKKQGTKYAVTVHDLGFLVLSRKFFDHFKIYYKFQLENTFKNADIVLADSQSTKNDIKKFFNIPDPKIKVVYLGANKIFFSDKKKRRLIPHKYFFSITTHPKRKNILGVLECIAMSKSLRNEESKYVIAGIIPRTQLLDLVKRIKELHLEDKVILFGYATNEQLISLYQNAEFFIYPSFYEGFGLPVLEAMACKCPVITSNNSSLPEIVPNKKWLVNPYNIEEISDKMIKIIKLSEATRKILVQENSEFAKKFTWEKTAREMVNIFESL